MRIDLFLVEKGYFASRSKAQDAIKKGAIIVNKKVAKSSLDVGEEDKIEILFETQKYVSRGGLKLDGAISNFNLNFKDKLVLDIGSSTGGFTDCALKHGALMVYSVDVGTDQLDKSLRDNPQVMLYENTNILDFDINVSFDYLVMDVSFVSIYTILPALKRFLNDTNKLICLIKPQFEAGKMINKGVIRDPKIHLEILRNVNRYLNEAGLYINKIIKSPIKGGSGNTEFLSIISKKKANEIDFRNVVKE